MSNFVAYWRRIQKHNQCTYILHLSAPWNFYQQTKCSFLVTPCPESRHFSLDEYHANIVNTLLKRPVRNGMLDTRFFISLFRCMQNRSCNIVWTTTYLREQKKKYPLKGIVMTCIKHWQFHKTKITIEHSSLTMFSLYLLQNIQCSLSSEQFPAVTTTSYK